MFITFITVFTGESIGGRFVSEVTSTLSASDCIDTDTVLAERSVPALVNIDTARSFRRWLESFNTRAPVATISVSASTVLTNVRGRLTFINIFAFSKSVNFVAFVTFARVSSVQVDAVAIATDASHEAFVDVLTRLLVPAQNESLVAVAREAASIGNVGAHTVLAQTGGTFVEVHAFGVVEFVEDHLVVARAVEAALEVVAHTTDAGVRSTAFVNICARFLSVHSLFLVPNITCAVVTGYCVDALPFAAHSWHHFAHVDSALRT